MGVLNQILLNKVFNSVNLTIFLLLIALLSSIYLFLEYENPKPEAFLCNINQTINCYEVTTSKYSYFLGIPFSIWGFLYFSVFLLLIFQRGRFKKIIFFYNLLGALFIPYFIYAEIQLKAICPLCTIVQLILVLLLPASWKIFKDRG